MQRPSAYGFHIPIIFVYVCASYLFFSIKTSSQVKPSTWNERLFSQTTEKFCIQFNVYTSIWIWCSSYARTFFFTLLKKPFHMGKWFFFYKFNFARQNMSQENLHIRKVERTRKVILCIFFSLYLFTVLFKSHIEIRSNVKYKVLVKMA